MEDNTLGARPFITFTSTDEEDTGVAPAPHYARGDSQEVTTRVVEDRGYTRRCGVVYQRCGGGRRVIRRSGN